MKNSKHIFLYNLIRVQTLKKEYNNFSYYDPTIKIVHSLFVLYFIIINSDDSLRNPVFTAIKSFGMALSQFQQLQTVLASLIIGIGLSMITSFLFLTFGNDKIMFERNRVKIQKVLIKSLVWLSLLFDLIAPVLLVFIISNFQLNDLDSFFEGALTFFCVMLSEVIIVYCNNLLVYNNKYLFLLLAFRLTEGFLPYLITTALTIYELYHKPSTKLPYLLVLVMAIIAFCGTTFHAYIDVFNTFAIFASIMLINLLMPQELLILNNVAQNDFLLEKIKKLSDDEELTEQQFLKTTLFLQDMQIKHKQMISPMQSQTIAKFSSKDINKTDLISLAMIKMDIDSKVFPNDLSIIIQRHECQFLSKTFTIQTLYQIEKLNREVQTRCIYDELYRMQAFMNKVQAEYLQSQGDVNSAIIYRTDKQIQRFYACIGLCIQQALSIWTITSKGIVNEQKFSKSLKKVMQLETQAFQILKQLKKFKNMAFEIDILNYLHRTVNVDGQNLMEADPFHNQDKIKDTHFILISNQIIEDISNIIAKTVSSNKQSLIGLNLSQILFDFYTVYLQEQMTCNQSLFQTHDPIFIPFKILANQKKIFVSQCVISILPDLTNGVKYIINFVKQSQSIKKYVLYCLQDDIIQGFSQSFYEALKINELLLPDILFGRQVFNIDFIKHINQSSMNKNIILKCDLLLKNFCEKKKVKRNKQRNSIPLQLNIKDIYKVKNLYYILFEIQTKQKSLISSSKQTLKVFVKQNTEAQARTSGKIDLTLCKINNPLQSTIDDRLSRISNHYRVFTYFKIIIYLLFVAFLLIFGSLIYIKLITEKIGVNFENQLSRTTTTNALSKILYLLYYQYYQYYQIKNYPEQILQIQPYNVPAIVKEYNTKTNENVIAMLPYILSNHGSHSSETYTKIFSGYFQEETIAAINLVDFLQGTKTALATNSPVFLVQNKQVADKIIDSFLPLDNQMMEQFKQNMFTYLLVSFIGIIIICVIVKIIYFRICFFKWKLFEIYLEIGKEELGSYTKRLKDFVNVLVQTKYYDKQEQSSGSFMDEESSKKQEKDMTFIQVTSQQAQQVKGIKKSSYVDKLMDKNLMLIIPILTLFFFIFYFGKISSFTLESDLILNYTKTLQTFSIVLLQRTTEYFQVGMQAILPQTQKKAFEKVTVLNLPTRLDIELPNYFDSYKQIQKGMLDFNLCKYSYLNTGSLYKNINCSLILDGIMEKSFTQTYSYLLLQLQQFKGPQIQDFGKQFRPKAIYPFYMQVCYARRTINNMLVFIQAKFNTTLSGYVKYRQTTMQTTINIGFIIVPIIIAVIIFFLRQLKKQCDFAVKCFKILPRRFIMKISMSKKLRNIGILDEIQMVAA